MNLPTKTVLLGFEMFATLLTLLQTRNVATGEPDAKGLTSIAWLRTCGW